jgi:hypothetical protein
MGLLAKQSKDCDTKGKDTEQHGKERHWEERSYPKEQKEQNGTPTGNCFRHVHFLFLLIS